MLKNTSLCSRLFVSLRYSSLHFFSHISITIFLGKLGLYVI
jgi:hypothetical protein